jgi:hypothetical protein
LASSQVGPRASHNWYCATDNDTAFKSHITVTSPGNHYFQRDSNPTIELSNVDSLTGTALGAVSNGVRINENGLYLMMANVGTVLCDATRQDPVYTSLNIYKNASTLIGTTTTPNIKRKGTVTDHTASLQTHAYRYLYSGDVLTANVSISTDRPAGNTQTCGDNDANYHGGRMFVAKVSSTNY